MMRSVESELSSTQAAIDQLTGIPQRSRSVLDDPKTLALIGLFLAVSFAVRILYTHGQSITFDENYEVLLGQQDLTYICHKGDGFPPLYAVTLHYWQVVFGVDSDASLFCRSRCLGMWRNWLGWVSTSVESKSAFGHWGSLLLLPIHAFYTSEGRAYSLLLLIATMALGRRGQSDSDGLESRLVLVCCLRSPGTLHALSLRSICCVDFECGVCATAHLKGCCCGGCNHHFDWTNGLLLGSL